MEQTSIRPIDHPTLIAHPIPVLMSPSPISCHDHLSFNLDTTFS